MAGKDPQRLWSEAPSTFRKDTHPARFLSPPPRHHTSLAGSRNPQTSHTITLAPQRPCNNTPACQSPHTRDPRNTTLACLTPSTPLRPAITHQPTQMSPPLTLILPLRASYGPKHRAGINDSIERAVEEGKAEKNQLLCVLWEHPEAPAEMTASLQPVLPRHGTRDSHCSRVHHLIAMTVSLQTLRWHLTSPRPGEWLHEQRGGGSLQQLGVSTALLSPSPMPSPLDHCAPNPPHQHWMKVGE